MLKARAIAVSLLLHLLPVALALYFMTKPPLSVTEVKTAEVEPSVQAPIGDVFVTEQETPPEGKSEAPPSTTEFPSEVKNTDEAAPSSAPGLPDGEAHPIGKIEPSYPALSRKLGEEGEAVFVLKVEESGQVSEATLEKSSGHERLDEAAKAALLAASFEPARKNGVALASRKTFRVEFRLDKSPHGK